MKTVAVLLLVANIAVTAYFFISDRSASPESDPAHQPINADRIRIVATGSEALALMRPKSAEGSAKAAAPECAVLEKLPEAQVTAAEARLASLDLGARLSRNEVNTGASSYLVMIPPLARRADLNRRVDELIRSGVADHFVINDGELRYGISLGFFKTEEAANRHLNDLKAKGVTDAVVRPRGSGNRTVTFVVKDLPEGERTKLEAIARELPGVELRVEPCPPADSAGRY